MTTPAEYLTHARLAQELHDGFAYRVNAAGLERTLCSEPVPVLVMCDARNKLEAIATALREAADEQERMTAWLKLIYDYDDGAWAAGHHHKG
jgi:hypothetical protein